MSFTTNAHIRQFATNVDNLWTGSLKTKLLDYLLRVVLRVRLAPTREKKNKARIIELAARKKEEIQTKKDVRKAENRMSRTLWKSRILCLTDDLERATRDDLWNASKDQYRRQKHVQAILEKLVVLKGQEPVVHPNAAPIEPLDIRAARITEVDSHNTTSNTTSSSNAAAPETSLSSILDSNATLSEEEEAQIATDWDVGDLEDLGLSARDLDDFEFDDPFDPDKANENEDGSQDKEPSRATLNSLQVLTRTLLESPFIYGDIDGPYVKASAYKGNKFTERHCQVVAEIVNLLRPYVPKRRPNPDQSGNKTLQPIAHVTLSAPIVIIANAVLRALGYPEFTRIISPQVSPSSSHALLLNSRGLYECLCSQEALRFDIKDKNGLPLTIANEATRNKAVVFASFFDIGKIEEMCHAHGLRFAHRFSFVDQYTIRIMGEVIPEGPDRGKRPISSTFEKRKKAKQAGLGFDWNEEARVQALSPAQINLELDGLETEIKKLEAHDKEIRKTLRDKFTTQSAYSIEHRRLSRTDQTHQQENDMRSIRKAAYRNLQAARAEVRQTQTLAEPIQASLRLMRQRRYYWNNVLRAAKDHRRPQRKKPPEPTVPTADDYKYEDLAERIDISQLPRHRVVFAGTDPGVVKMNVTCPQTLTEMETHFNRYQLLYGRCG